MSEPRRIAGLLTDGTDMAAAALLVAICDDDGVVVPREDMALVRELERMGCLHEGKRTPLGIRVGIILRAELGIRPRPGAQA
jgi:ABC-type uncharacterized transport system ATPase subunit